MTPRPPLFSHAIPKYMPYMVGGVLSGAQPPVPMVLTWDRIKAAAPWPVLCVVHDRLPANDGSDLLARGPAVGGLTIAAVRELKVFGPLRWQKGQR